MLDHLTEQHSTGLDALRLVTVLLQRIRSEHPTAGLFEAADLQWWWARPRSTDTRPQQFWVDELGRPAAAAIATGWGDSVGLDLVQLPDATRDERGAVLDRALEHAEVQGDTGLSFAVSTEDDAMLDALEARGFTELEPELVESWLDAGQRPDVSPLADGYRLSLRADADATPHHMTARVGRDVETRLMQTSLYRADLDLAVHSPDGRFAACGLFWFDPVSRTGLVEPMRTEDDHQRRGLARHVLTAGINRLIDAGATRVKICYSDENLAARRLYLDAGFRPDRSCWTVSAP